VRFAAAALFALFLIAGCGGDEEEPETVATPTTAETQTTATEETVTEPEVETATEVETEPETVTVETETSPEDQPGGAGDEEPARSQALFTAAGGRVTPRVVRVPSFIAVRVELRARDAGPYTLTIGGQTIEVGAALNSMSVSLDGLRPGDAYVGKLGGQATGRIRVEATAEPGP
jgi:ABC-type glycerol-3-phosphate transport system substrate-binding protein